MWMYIKEINLNKINGNMDVICSKRYFTDMQPELRRSEEIIIE